MLLLIVIQLMVIYINCNSPYSSKECWWLKCDWYAILLWHKWLHFSCPKTSFKKDPIPIFTLKCIKFSAALIWVWQIVMVFIVFRIRLTLVMDGVKNVANVLRMHIKAHSWFYVISWHSVFGRPSNGLQALFKKGNWLNILK